MHAFTCAFCILLSPAVANYKVTGPHGRPQPEFTTNSIRPPPLSGFDTMQSIYLQRLVAGTHLYTWVEKDKVE